LQACIAVLGKAVLIASGNQLSSCLGILLFDSRANLTDDSLGSIDIRNYLKEISVAAKSINA